MNIPRILEIADMLEKRQLPDGWAFGMMSYVQEVDQICDFETVYLPGHDIVGQKEARALNCKTAACIAGHVFLKYHPESDPFNISSLSIAKIAEEDLGLDVDTACNLFSPPGMDLDYNVITPERAARVLRHLAATGVVDWSIM